MASSTATSDRWLGRERAVQEVSAGKVSSHACPPEKWTEACIAMADDHEAELADPPEPTLFSSDGRVGSGTSGEIAISVVRWKRQSSMVLALGQTAKL